MPLRDLHRNVGRFHRLGLNTSPAFGDQPRNGQVLWGARVCGQYVGIAWDWTEFQEGVVILSDPMALISNMVLVDDRGNSKTLQESLPHLNMILYQLDWQSDILGIERQPLRLAA